ncbi:hypothetical protein BDY19DRAFT_950952 [Irpex rosettiformis]|uniref:Uncharacterized protein n=1 Tax=Irpex rosettiformis TaxID=378272 RepID=A0ACB8U359_9APHY|nr:hypothetical protein BDY19DRAFT_950952 [Irpex rosettiformis]
MLSQQWHIYPPPLTTSPSFTILHSVQVSNSPNHSYLNTSPVTSQDMSKRVHFAPEPARTPSPSFSTSSFDSPGPRTPPSLPPHQLPPQVCYSLRTSSLPLIVLQSPYGYSKPFPPSPAGLQVNPLIATASHAGASQRPFVWDLRNRPSDIAPQSSSYDSAYPIPASSLALAATTPPAYRLEIRCTQLPWKFTVTPSQRFKNVCVTVGDVMSELYNALRLQISQEEFHVACGGNPQYRQQVEASYERRVARSKSPREERAKGIRRIDLLGDYTLFSGFEGVVGDTTSLMLVVHPRH